MAEKCEIFGDLVPNVYIDKIFLQEDRVNVTLKLVDRPQDGGLTAILGQVDLNKYLKIHCILATGAGAGSDAEAVENGLDNKDHISQGPHTLPGLWRQRGLDTFSSYVIDQQGNINLVKDFEFFAPYTSNTDFENLSVFAFAQLDTKQLESDLNTSAKIPVVLPESLINLSSPYIHEIVIKDFKIVSLMKAYEIQGTTSIYVPKTGLGQHDHTYQIDSSGNGYTEYAVSPADPQIRHRHRVIAGIVQEAQSAGVGSHIHELVETFINVYNVHDFRIRNTINALIAEFDEIIDLATTNFPEQTKILNSAISQDSYFTQFYVTKDATKTARFLFAFDRARYIFENSAYSKLIKAMSDNMKQKILSESKITQFKLVRQQVKENISHNRLGTPLRDYRFFGNGTFDKIVVDSLNNSNITEIDVLLPDQVDTSNSDIRFYTGEDISIKSETDGKFRYALDMEINDAFISIVKEQLQLLSNAAGTYAEYTTKAQIPNYYDHMTRTFLVTNFFDIPASFSFNKATLFVPELTRLTEIVDAYLNTLGLFVNISSRQSDFQLAILNFIRSDIGTIDGVLLFSDMLNDLIAEVNKILKISHSVGSVESASAVEKTNKIFAFGGKTHTPAMYHRHVFKNVVDARYYNEKWVDNISKEFVSTATGPFGAIPTPRFAAFGRLNIYTEDDLIAATSTYSKTAETTEEQAYYVSPKYKTTQSLKKLSEIIAESPGFSENLLIDELSAADLSDKKFDETILSSVIPPVDEPPSFEVLTNFLVPTVSTPIPWPGPFSPSFSISMNKILLRDATFIDYEKVNLERMQTTGQYFFCRQRKRSDMEVFDSYFLLTPSSPVPFEQMEPEDPSTMGEEKPSETKAGPVAQVAVPGLGPDITVFEDQQNSQSYYIGPRESKFQIERDVQLTIEEEENPQIYIGSRGGGVDLVDAAATITTLTKEQNKTKEKKTVRKDVVDVIKGGGYN